jgi:hypothetical protein
MRRRRRRTARKHVVLLTRARPHYDRMLEEQGGVCAICKVKGPTAKRRLDIDHDHTLMIIRGLLCPRCNILLGAIRDPKWLRSAAEYLERGGFPWLNALLQDVRT